MRVAVKNMSGVFIHSTTPRKARLLLKEKKAVIESNNPFTIRLLFSESECGLKDSFLQQNKSDLASEKDNTMCEYRPYKNNSKTHLIFGATGCGKTTMFKQLIQEKLHRDEDVCIIGNAKNKGIYFKDNNLLHFYSPNDMSEFSNSKSPEKIAKCIINFYTSHIGRANINTIAIDGLEQFILNRDYSKEEFFRELAKECRTNDINFLYTLGADSDKNEVYHKLPEIYERFSDIITVLK